MREKEDSARGENFEAAKGGFLGRGFSSSVAMKWPKRVRMVSPSGLMVLGPGLVLVWDSKTGSFTLLEMAARRGERMSPAS